MKKTIIKVIFILTVSCGLITMLNLSVLYILPVYLSYKYKINVKDAAATGIIGGADGPSAIFISGQTSQWFTALFALLTVSGILCLVINRFKKRTN